MQLFGKYYGICAEAADELLRIKVKVPQIFGQEILEEPALPCVPMEWIRTVKDGGAMDPKWAPQVGDPVWIEFVAGDPDHPVWSGSWFTK